MMDVTNISNRTIVENYKGESDAEAVNENNYGSKT